MELMSRTNWWNGLIFLHGDKNYLVGMGKNGRDLLDRGTIKSGVSHRSFNESRRLTEWFLNANNDWIIFGLAPIYSVSSEESLQRYFRNKCSENMQQIYKRTSMTRCDFKKVAKQFYWNRTSAWVFSCKFAVYFQNKFS